MPRARRRVLAPDLAESVGLMPLIDGGADFAGQPKPNHRFSR